MNPWQAQEVIIDRITAEIEGVATYHLRFADSQAAKSYRFLPGQFNMLYVPGVGESAVSLSADPASRRTWAHTVRVAGNVTRTLAGLGVGGAVGLRGPFGSSWPIDRAMGKSLVLAAGGIGLPPLRPVIYEILGRRREFGDVTLLYGARTPETLMFAGEHAEWSRKGIDVRLTVDRSSTDWKGTVGVVPLLLDRVPVRDPSQTLVFTCGPEVMMRYVAESALRRGIPRQNLWLSMERNMQCAIGLCGHCQFGPAFICRDGPIFPHDRLAPFLEVEGL